MWFRRENDKGIRDISVSDILSVRVKGLEKVTLGRRRAGKGSTRDGESRTVLR